MNLNKSDLPNLIDALAADLLDHPKADHYRRGRKIPRVSSSRRCLTEPYRVLTVCGQGTGFRAVVAICSVHGSGQEKQRSAAGAEFGWCGHSAHGNVRGCRRERVGSTPGDCGDVHED